MSVFGIDYAWGRPGVVALKQAGARFVCRYLSHDTTGKNLTPAEAKLMSDADISIVVVWESAANRALAGRAAGAADAEFAVSQAHACGMPDDRPIYFAVDFDASAAQQAAINAYLDGAASVIGKDHTGLYGGYRVVKRALDGGHATWAWQTYAWSGGVWDGRAQLRQYSNDHQLNGVGVDYNRAVKDDFGQWKVGESPVAVSDADIAKIAQAVWMTDGIIDNPVANPKNPQVKGSWVVTDIDRQVRNLAAMVAALSKQIPADGVDEQAIVQGVLAGLSPETIAAAVVAAMPADEAKRVADELAARLAS